MAFCCFYMEPTVAQNLSVKCQVTHGDQQLTFEDTVDILEFNSDSVSLYDNRLKSIRRWENIEARSLEVDCEVSPRYENSSIRALCYESLAKLPSPIWSFHSPEPLPAYGRDRSVEMTAEKAKIGKGRVWTFYKVAVSSSKLKPILALEHHPENTVFDSQPKFSGNYSGINGLQYLSPTQNCSISSTGADTGVN